MSRSRRDGFSYLIFLVATGVCFTQGVPPTAWAEPDSLKSEIDVSDREKSLSQHWAAYGKSINTLHIKYKAYGSSRGLRPLQPEDVLKLFDPDGLIETPDAFDGLLKRLVTDPDKAGHPWPVEFYSDKKKTREETIGSIHVFDGVDEVFRDLSNRQTHIGTNPDGFSRQRNVRGRFYCIRHNPNFGLVKYVQGDGVKERFVYRSEDTLQGDVSWFEVDRKTQMIERLVLVASRGDEESARVIVQGGWTEYEPGYYWPQAYGEFQFMGKPPVLQSVDIKVTTSIEFNEPIDAQKFIVPGRPGDVVFDFRKKGSGVCFDLKEEADDVKKTFRP